MPKKRSALVLGLLLCLLAGGCATLLLRLEPPRLTLSDFKLLDVRLLEQKYLLVLRVQNPNSTALAVEGMDYELLVNGKPFGSGVCSKAVTIPGYGTEVVEVEAYSTVASVWQQLLSLARGETQTFRYRLRGHVRLAHPSTTLPFDLEDHLTLGPPKPAVKT